MIIYICKFEQLEIFNKYLNIKLYLLCLECKFKNLEELELVIKIIQQEVLKYLEEYVLKKKGNALNYFRSTLNPDNGLLRHRHFD